MFSMMAAVALLVARAVGDLVSLAVVVLALAGAVEVMDPVVLALVDPVMLLLFEVIPEAFVGEPVRLAVFNPVVAVVEA